MAMQKYSPNLDLTPSSHHRFTVISPNSPRDQFCSTVLASRDQGRSQSGAKNSRADLSLALPLRGLGHLDLAQKGVSP